MRTELETAETRVPCAHPWGLERPEGVRSPEPVTGKRSWLGLGAARIDWEEPATVASVTGHKWEL